MTDPDRLLEIYAMAERDPSSGGTGIFTITRANFWIPGVHGTVYLLMCVWREDDRNEMPIVAVSGPFVRKVDAERLHQKLAAIWQSEPFVDMTDPEMWPSNQVHPKVWRAAVVWAVEQWLVPTHRRQ